MAAFLIWTLVITLLIGLYGGFLWRRSRKSSRFQARLTILFMLFGLLPIIPLTLLTSYLLTKSGEMLGLPGLEKSLSQSMTAIRLQLRWSAENFSRVHPDAAAIPLQNMAAENVSYAGRAHFFAHGHRLLVLVRADTLLSDHEQLFSSDFSLTVDSTNRMERLIDRKGTPIFEYFQGLADSSYYFIGMRIPVQVARASEQIIRTSRNYAGFLLLRDKILEHGVIGTIAMVFMLFIALIAIFAARLISRQVSEPIRSLTEGMRQVGAGELDFRVRTTARDELAFLIDSFNQMAQELKSNRESLQRAERLAAWRDVARQVSHEIKNPLTPIQMSLYRIKNTLPQEWRQNTDLQEAFRIIEEELASIRRMTEEFSQLARLPELQRKPEKIDEIVRHSVKLFQAEYSKVQVRTRLDASMPPVLLDREQFRRAVHNLLKNAMEASAPGNHIDISMQRSADPAAKPILCIQDYGIGMDEETVKRATEPYFTTKARGSGLGLAIVQQIIEEHGGRLSIISEIGKGTAIRIIFD